MSGELHNLDRTALINLFFDSIHLTIMHYGLWFRETERQVGLEKAAEIDNIAWEKILHTFTKRITSRLGIPIKDDPAELLEGLSREKIIKLLEDMAKNWLACDGIWFQAVEQNFDYGMNTAKRINDTCLTRFSYLEARTIMKRLNLPENGGIPVLKEALKHRLYGLMNVQEIIDPGNNKLSLRMRDCRVQSARNRKGLPDYPCKSAGIVEYTSFAAAVDPQIKVTCVGCPPDPHPEEWWCAWDFEV